MRSYQGQAVITKIETEMLCECAQIQQYNYWAPVS